MHLSTSLPLFLLNKFRSLLSLKYLSASLALIAMFLIVFLSLACHRPASGFSEIYLIEAVTSNGQNLLRAGYFRMCETASGLNGTLSASKGTSMVCKNLGEFNNPELAYTFSKHVVRPYFVVITAVLTAATLVAAVITCIRVHRPLVDQVALGITAVTLAFAVITACWQQVAVNAASQLLENGVKRGYRAGGLAWGAVSLLILCIGIQVVVAQLETEEDDENQDVEDKYSAKTANSVFSYPFSK